MPKWAGTIYELLSAPVSALEAVCGYVGAAATKSVIIGVVILATARLFVPYEVQNWPLAILFLVLTCISFCLFGFILGVLADGFEKLQIVPMLILTPLTFLGGTFYSIDMLPEPWRTITLFNPVVYLISGFRYAFFGAEAADVNIGVSLAAISVFLTVCLGAVWWIFKTGYRLKV
jgi:ABC-2 type transport system permease protein